MNATLDEELISTTDLVLAAQQGDRNAFGELFRRFERSVFAIALRRLRDFNEAQELTQEVFIQAMTKLTQLREPECFGGWLKSITHRMAINRIVRRSPDRAVEPESLEATCVEHRTPLSLVMDGERSQPGSRWIEPAARSGPRDAGRVLREWPVADRNERGV